MDTSEYLTTEGNRRRKNAFRTAMTLVMLIICLGLFCTSCKPNNRFIPASPAAVPVLKQLLDEAPLFVVDLDSVPVDTLYPDLVIGPAEPDSGELFLSLAFSLTLKGDTVYVADGQQNIILAAHKEETRFTRSIGGPGEGPGEFSRLRGVYNNDDYFFATDARTQRVKIFGPDFTFEESLEFGMVYAFGFSANPFGVISRSALRAESLLTLLDPAPPFSELRTFFPRLVPFDDKASGYDSPFIGSNVVGDIVAVYSGVPYIFLFDRNLNHTATIELAGSHIPSLNEHEEGGFGKLRIRSFYTALMLSDNGRIYFSARGKVYEISPARKGYELSHTFRFLEQRQDFEALASNVVSVFGRAIDGSNRMYVTALRKPHVFRYLLPTDT